MIVGRVNSIREAGATFFDAALDLFGTIADFRQLAREIGQRTSRKGPALFMPLRAALTGVTHGPELAPLFALMSPDKIRQRFSNARRLAE